MRPASTNHRHTYHHRSQLHRKVLLSKSHPQQFLSQNVPVVFPWVSIFHLGGSTGAPRQCFGAPDLQEQRNNGPWKYEPERWTIVLFAHLTLLSFSTWLIDHPVSTRPMHLVELLVFPDQQASQSESEKPSKEGEGCTDGHTLDVSGTFVRGKRICSQKRLLKIRKDQHRRD